MEITLPQDGDLQSLCERFGVEYEPDLDAPDFEDLRPAEVGDVPPHINGHDTREMADTSGPLDTLRQKFTNHQPITLMESTGQAPRTFGDEGPFGEVGAPGTRVVGGVLDAEPTPKYRPYQVRGHVTRHGLYEKFYRQEPVLFEGINEGNNIFAAGNIRFVEPDVPESQKRTAESFTEWCNDWLRQIWRGPQYYQRHVGAAKIFGFYPFEVVWGVDKSGRIRPTKLAPREPATVDKWIFDPRGTELVGATFRMPQSSYATGRKQAKSLPHSDRRGQTAYTLTAQGPALPDHKLHIPAIYARANNIEGISVIRPVIHWVKFKQVLHQIAAVTAQKYGVPMAVIKEEPIDGDALGNASDQRDSSFIFRKVAGQQAKDAPVFQLARGYDIKLLDPGGTMPTLTDLLQYSDQMISKTTKSEAGLLGQGTVGSYALSETLDNAMVRAQPGFAADVLQPLGWMVRDIAKWHGVKLDRYPEPVWEMDGFADGSKWIEDATRLMGGAPMWQWPDEMQKEAAKKLNLSPGLFDDFDPPEPAPQVQGTQFSDGHDYDCGEHGCDGMVWEFEDQPGIVEGMQYDEAIKFRERMEKQVGEALRSVAQDHRRAFRDKVRDGEMTLKQADDYFRANYLPRYEDVVQEAFDDASDKGKKKMLRRMGFTVPRDAEMPTTEAMKESIEATVYAVAREMYSRQQGVLVDAMDDMVAMQDDIFGDDDIPEEERERRRRESGVRRTNISLPVLASSTTALIARGIVTEAVNAGRDDLMEVANDSEPQAPHIMAMRTSMLDGDVCEVCQSLDFEEGDSPAVHRVGSDAYYEDMPPAKCLAKRRCRCAYIYDIPDDYRGTLEQIAAGEGFSLPGAA